MDKTKQWWLFQTHLYMYSSWSNQQVAIPWWTEIFLIVFTSWDVATVGMLGLSTAQKALWNALKMRGHSHCGKVANWLKWRSTRTPHRSSFLLLSYLLAMYTFWTSLSTIIEHDQPASSAVSFAISHLDRPLVFNHVIRSHSPLSSSSFGHEANLLNSSCGQPMLSLQLTQARTWCEPTRWQVHWKVIGSRRNIRSNAQSPGLWWIKQRQGGWLVVVWWLTTSSKQVDIDELIGGWWFVYDFYKLVEWLNSCWLIISRWRLVDIGWWSSHLWSMVEQYPA